MITATFDAKQFTLAIMASRDQLKIQSYKEAGADDEFITKKKAEMYDEMIKVIMSTKDKQ